MKKQWIAFFLLVFLPLISVFAQKASGKTNTETIHQNPLSLHASYAYRDYKFRSHLPRNFGRFHGHSHLYLIGGNQFFISNSISAGLFVYKLDSASNFQLTSADETNLTIHNYTVFTHIIKRVKPQFFIDLTGGIGQNNINYATFAPENPIIGQVGVAKSRSLDWFTSIKALYSRPWRHYLLTGGVGLAHGEVHQNDFTYTFISPIPQMKIPKLSSQATLLLESAEISYQVHAHLKPFITGGLIQVLDYGSSRPLASPMLAGTLPEIVSKENGYQAGVGFSYAYQQFVFRFEQQYYQRGHNYHSNQSIASLKVALG